MKILRRGEPVICKDCGCIFEYEKEDVRLKEEIMHIIKFLFLKMEDHWRVKYVECPHCGYHVEIAVELINDEIKNNKSRE